MPYVPKGQVADPFGNRVEGKDQSRVPPPAPVFEMIAAAEMHRQGRLFDPTPMKEQTSYGPVSK